jgi:hypothetical protein
MASPKREHRQHRRWVRPTAAGLVLLVALSAGCARQLPSRVDPPSNGQPAEIGVAYGVSVSCPIPIELGGLWWVWDEPMGAWPDDISIPPFPLSIWASRGIPYAVPGVVTLTDADSAVFRADVDGSEFQLTAHDENPTPGNACL